jgi:hypothetical protein
MAKDTVDIASLPEFRQRLLEAFSYDPETGAFKYRHIKVPDADPYTYSWKHRRRVTFEGRRWLTYHLIWIMVYAEAAEHIDHINGDRHDNRLCNLRKADIRENSRNVRPHKDTGRPYKGIEITKQGRYLARICVDYRRIGLGTYDTPEEAARAYDVAALLHHGEFACTNESLGLL